MTYRAGDLLAVMAAIASVVFLGWLLADWKKGWPTEPITKDRPILEQQWR